MQSMPSENPLATMKAGSLLLKQESNGLHLRWIVLNSTNDTIYWLNPKKETLVIDSTNSIAINTITKVTIGPDFKQLIKDNQQSVLESLSVASFRIFLSSPEKEVDIYCPLYADFDIWVKGLVQLLPTNIFQQISITPEHQNEVDCITRGDPEALRLRLCELVELADSLLKESASLMEIRSRRDYCISILGNRLKRMMAKKQQGDDTKTAPTADDATTRPLNVSSVKPAELVELREKNAQLQAYLEQLEKTDNALDSKLRHQHSKRYDAPLLLSDGKDDEEEEEEEENEEEEDDEDDLADTNYTLSDTPWDEDNGPYANLDDIDYDVDDEDLDADDEEDDDDIAPVQGNRRPMNQISRSTNDTIAALESRLSELNDQRDALLREKSYLRYSAARNARTADSSSRRSSASRHHRSTSASSANRRYPQQLLQQARGYPSSSSSSTKPNTNTNARKERRPSSAVSTSSNREGGRGRRSNSRSRENQTDASSYIPLTQFRSIISHHGRVTPTLQAKQQYKQQRRSRS